MNTTRGVWLLALDGCAAKTPVLPDVAAATFVEGVDNPWFPLPVGATWSSSAETPDGVETGEVEVLDEVRVVNGVNATVVHDIVYLDGEIVEETDDWYAQDSDGNVWYLGEDTCEFEGGACVRHAGAWEWGVDGALPGIVMWGDPQVGDPYYQEFYPGVAEDVGQVLAVGESATTPAGTFGDCVRTADTSTLDPKLQEQKVYCRGVGNVIVEEGDVTVALVASSLP